jgi:hypothetical protein
LQPKAITNSSGLNPERSEAMQPLFGIAKANLLLGDVALAAVSSPIVALKAFGGSALNQSGRPSTAEIGCGMIVSSPGGQRNVTVI